MKKIKFFAFALMLGATSCGTTSQHLNLEATRWQAEEMNGKAIEAQDDSFTLSFNEDMQLSAKAACNVIMGSYKYSEKGDLTLTQIGTTRAMCPDMEKEAEYIQLLNDANRAEIENEKLVLFNEDKAIAKFKAIEE